MCEHQNTSAADDLPKLKSPGKDLRSGKKQIIFAHSEALLSNQGREILKSKVFKENVAAIVVDEAYYVEIRYVFPTAPTT